MAKMMGRNIKKGICSCPDCSGPDIHGRAAEKRQWRREENDAYDGDTPRVVRD